MTKKKIKAGELTLNQIVEIAEKNKESCTRCPLYPVPYISCFEVCERSLESLKEIKQELNEMEIEVEDEQ